MPAPLQEPLHLTASAGSRHPWVLSPRPRAALCGSQQLRLHAWEPSCHPDLLVIPYGLLPGHAP